MNPAEEIALDLEGTLRELEDANAAADRVYDTVLKAMSESALKEFPVLKNMSAEQIRKFGEKLSRLSLDCATTVADLAFAAEQEKR
jgi:hypothetical protein